MNSLCILGIVCLIIGVSYAENICKGCVNIDEHSLEKVLDKFDVILLKFDDTYRYQDVHYKYTKIADEVTDDARILMGLVDIKYYGTKDNQEFAKRFGINSKKDLPALRLYVKGVDEPFEYPKSGPWNEDHMRNFVNDNSNVYLARPGCLETFDKLAKNFIASRDKEVILKEAEEEADKLTLTKEQNAARTYIKIMKKVIENGESFIKKERKRVKKILNSEVSENTEDDLSRHLNILKSFVAPSKITAN